MELFRTFPGSSGNRTVAPCVTVPIRSPWAVEGIVPLIILLCDSRNETPGFFNNPTWKIKLVSIGIDSDYIGFTADHVSADQFGLQWRMYLLTGYKCEILSLKNDICVLSSIDRRFFKCVNQELSFYLFFYSLCYRISGSTSSLLARQSQRFWKTS